MNLVHFTILSAILNNIGRIDENVLPSAGFATKTQRSRKPQLN